MSSLDQVFDQISRSQAINAMHLDLAPLLVTLQDKTLPRRQYSNLQMAYVRSEPARLLAATRALPHEASNEEIRAVADAIDHRAPSSELIPWRRVRKKSGQGFRPICELPPVVKAEHYLVRDLIVAALPDMDHLYDVQGGGTFAAVEAFKNALGEGYDWCWSGDIRDCFQTVDTNALIDCLPLPRQIVTNWLDYRCLNLSEEPLNDRNSSGNILYMARGIRRNRPCGLLLGSPASNSILAMLLSSLASVFVLHDCIACLFADNLFVAAKTMAERDAVVSEICDHLITHPAGRFRLHKQRKIAPQERFDMLGWTIIPTDGLFNLEPTHAAIDRMWGKLADAEDADIARADGEITDTRKIANGYSGSFKLWPETEQLMEGLLDRAEEFVQTATSMKRARETAQLLSSQD